MKVAVTCSADSRRNRRGPRSAAPRSSLIRAKIKLPRPDEGIDILAETYDGDLWAIQTKFRSNSGSTLTRQKLSTFVALASVAGISRLVVAHTSARPIRKRALMGNIVEIGLERWFALDEDAWSLNSIGIAQFERK